jgi:hypothetical protein
MVANMPRAREIISAAVGVLEAVVAVAILACLVLFDDRGALKPLFALGASSVPSGLPAPGSNA